MNNQSRTSRVLCPLIIINHRRTKRAKNHDKMGKVEKRTTDWIRLPKRRSIAKYKYEPKAVQSRSLCTMALVLQNKWVVGRNRECWKGAHKTVGVCQISQSLASSRMRWNRRSLGPPCGEPYWNHRKCSRINGWTDVLQPSLLPSPPSISSASPLSMLVL